MKLISILSVVAILSFSCKAKSVEITDTYISKDPFEKNQQIRSASQRGEAWTMDPLLIIHKLWGPDYLIRNRNIYSCDLVLDSADNYTVTLIQDGYLNQPLYGVKVILQLKWIKIDNYWEVVSMKEGYKCGGPKAYYSSRYCPELPAHKVRVTAMDTSDVNQTPLNAGSS
jgi:hypothetical protein